MENGVHSLAGCSCSCSRSTGPGASQLLIRSLMSLLVGEYSCSSDDDTVRVGSGGGAGAAPAAVAACVSAGAVGAPPAAAAGTVPLATEPMADAVQAVRLRDLVFSDARGPLPPVEGLPTAAIAERVRRLEAQRAVGAPFLAQRLTAPETLHASSIAHAAAAGGVADAFVSHVPREVFDRAALPADAYFDTLARAVVPSAQPAAGPAGFVAAVSGGAVGARPSRWNT